MYIISLGGTSKIINIDFPHFFVLSKAKKESMQIIQMHCFPYVYDFISFLHKMEYPIEYFIEDLTEYGVPLYTLCIPCRIPSGIAYRISPRIPFVYE